MTATPEAAAGAAPALVTPGPRRRIMVIVNPYATTVSDRLRSLVVHALRGRFDVVAVDTQRQGHGIELARAAAAEAFDAVVAFGGDGTVNEAANGIAGTDTVLTALPGGATNVVAKMLGIPGDIVDATEHLLRVADDWRPRRIDLASVDGRGFLFAAGLGIDAAVVRHCDAHPRAKARFKQWYFAGAAVRTFGREYLVHPPRLEVEVAGRRIPGMTAVVQNGETFTYFRDKALAVAEGVRLDDGLLGGVVLERATPLDVPSIAVRILSQHLRVTGHRRVRAWSGEPEAVVRSLDGRPLPLEVDGDYLADVAEARFSVSPGAVRVVA